MHMQMHCLEQKQKELPDHILDNSSWLCRASSKCWPASCVDVKEAKQHHAY
jgi:hypothetical protein